MGQGTRYILSLGLASSFMAAAYHLLHRLLSSPPRRLRQGKGVKGGTSCSGSYTTLRSSRNSPSAEMSHPISSYSASNPRYELNMAGRPPSRTRPDHSHAHILASIAEHGSRPSIQLSTPTGSDRWLVEVAAKAPAEGDSGKVPLSGIPPWNGSAP